MNNYLEKSEMNQSVMSSVKVKAASLPKAENSSAFAWMLKISVFLIVAGLTAITLLLHSCISGAVG